MPDLILPASARATAGADPRPRGPSDGAGQGLTAPPNDFARTLQTQMDDRQSAARRAQQDGQRAREPERPQPGPSPQGSPAPSAPAPETNADETTRAEADKAETSTQAAAPASTEPNTDQACDTDAADVPGAAGAAEAGNAVAAQLAAIPSLPSTPPCDTADPDAGGDAPTALDRPQTVRPATAQALPEHVGAASPRTVASEGSGQSPTTAKSDSGAENPLRAGTTNRRDTPASARLGAANALTTDPASGPGAGTAANQGEGAPAQGPLAGASHFLTAGLRPQAAATAPAPTAFVATPADQPGFADELGQRVVLFAGRSENKAELILTPAHLGRVEVTLTLSGEQATAQFVASTQAARDAIDQALPRLREMMADAGIQLGESQVGTRSDQQERHAQRGSGFGGSDFPSGADTTAGARQWIRVGNGMIDTFA